MRWWITSDVSAIGDTDFTVDRLVDRANETLAKGFGNAVNRVATLRHRNHDRGAVARAGTPLEGVAGIDRDVATALADFARRAAAERISGAIDEVNRSLEATQPWKLAKNPDASDELAGLLANYRSTLERIASALAIITPDLARAAIGQLAPATPPAPSPLCALRSIDPPPTTRGC